jgi:hypothetical protein
MNIIRLYGYPIAIAILIPILCFLPYLIAINNEHVDPLLPYISDSGTIAPEAGYYAQIMLIIALLFGVLSYLQYLQLNTIYTINDHMIQLKPSLLKNRVKIVKFNRWSLYLGIYIVLIATSIVSFRPNEFPILHPILSFSIFISIIAYMALKTWISFQLSPQVNSKLIAKIRMIITILSVLSFLVMIVTGIWSLVVTENKTTQQRLKWKSSDSGYYQHVVSSFANWIFVLLLSPFFATYFQETKRMKINNGVLRIQFTTIKTNNNNKKNVQTKM